jgi:hypothetical protein
MVRNAKALMAVATCIITATSTAQSRGAFELNWWTIDGGGAMHTVGGSFELSGTIGQPEAGRMTGGNFQLVGGFWPAATSLPCPEDVDEDGDIDIQDLAYLLGNFGMSGGGLTGDIDADQDVDLQDLAFLLAVFGGSCR